MRYDIDRLAAFYSTPLGRAADEYVARRIAALWPTADGLDVLCLGHAEAIAARWLGGARRVVSAAPGGQGALRWPETGRSLTALVDEDRLPFIDAVFDRVLIRHGLEETDNPRALLREIWRVTAPEGRLIVVAAHRRGLWSRAESTPYGHGRSFTRGQLTRLLEDGMFQPTASARALYFPPIDWPVITASADAWERAGRFTWTSFGGALLVEAVKRVTAEPARKGVRAVGAAQANPVRAASLEPVLRKVCNSRKCSDGETSSDAAPNQGEASPKKG